TRRGGARAWPATDWRAKSASMRSVPAEMSEARVATSRCPGRARGSGTSASLALPERALWTICFMPSSLAAWRKPTIAAPGGQPHFRWQEERQNPRTPHPPLSRTRERGEVHGRRRHIKPGLIAKEPRPAPPRKSVSNEAIRHPPPAYLPPPHRRHRRHRRRRLRHARRLFAVAAAGSDPARARPGAAPAIRERHRRTRLRGQ